MENQPDFLDTLLGFVPVVGFTLALITVFWAATKLFPEFGIWVTVLFNKWFGVDEEYDRKYNTGYDTPTSHNRW